MALFGREPPPVANELLMRPRLFRIFVSSQMSGGAFVAERVAAAEAIDATGFADSWYWERDAAAGPYCSTGVCVGYAGASDGLVLILGETLTEITRKEYRAAKAAGALCVVLVAQGVTRDNEAEAFLRSERRTTTTANFGSVEELKSRIVAAIREYMVGSARKKNIARRGSAPRVRRRR
jgi:hypothetical protein